MHRHRGFSRVGFAKVELQPVEQRLVIRHMPGQKFLVRPFRCRLNLPADLGVRIVAPPTLGEIRQVVGARRQQEGDAGRVGDLELALRSG